MSELESPIHQAPIHPGEHLAEFLEEYEISEYRLAKTINVPPRRINEIVKGKRGISADTAIRLGKAFRMSPESWLNLQKLYELSCARQTVIDHIDPLTEPPVAA
jgi:addiction module HigA family antidote